MENWPRRICPAETPSSGVESHKDEGRLSGLSSGDGMSTPHNDGDDNDGNYRRLEEKSLESIKLTLTRKRTILAKPWNSELDEQKVEEPFIPRSETLGNVSRPWRVSDPTADSLLESFNALYKKTEVEMTNDVWSKSSQQDELTTFRRVDSLQARRIKALGDQESLVLSVDDSSCKGSDAVIDQANDMRKLSSVAMHAMLNPIENYDDMEGEYRQFRAF